MTKRRDVRSWRPMVSAALLAGGLGMAAVGCNAGTGGLSAAAQGEAMAAAAIQGGAIPSLLAIQQALFEVNATAFAALPTSSLCTSASTTAGTGDVTLDFGTGANCPSPYGGINSGSFSSTFTTSTGNRVLVTSTFATTFEVTPVGGAKQTVDGSLTADLTISGSTATGSISGTITHQGPAGNRSLVFALTSVTIDSTNLSAPKATLGGTITVHDPVLGNWTIELTGIVVQFDTGCIDDGVAQAAKFDVLRFEFKSCNAGDIRLKSGSASAKIGTFRW